MKVSYRREIVFKFIYLALIIITGSFLSFYSSGFTVPMITIGVSVIYILVSFKKEIKRYGQLKKEFPTEWKTIIKKYSEFYNYLDEKGKVIFENDIVIFLSDYGIRGIRGEEVDLKTKVLIAIGVATILHGRPEWEPPFRDGVVVYPGETFDKEYKLHKGQIAGMAGDRRPLLITKEILEKSFLYPEDGYNSLLHEIAHYFDFENPMLMGVPVIGSGKREVERWMEIMEKERNKVIEGRSFLRSYAGTNEAEFFAVATEFFFEKPDSMYKNNPDLYNVLLGFYNVDTKKILSSRNSDKK